MSYSIDLIIKKLPADQQQAWQEIEALREVYYEDERPVASQLQQLHAQLTARYPCLCDFAEDDPAMDDSPWADGPMINNFSHDMGMLAIVYSKVEQVLPFIIQQANQLGITVADGQDGQIYRPE